MSLIIGIFIFLSLPHKIDSYEENKIIKIHVKDIDINYRKQENKPIEKTFLRDRKGYVSFILVKN